MNRISRRPRDEAADAWLEAGRREASLEYDVQRGLARHRQWLRSEAPVPEWASTSPQAATVVPVALKAVVTAMVVGALGVVAWQQQLRPEPPAADKQQAAPHAETRDQQPGAEGAGASPPAPAPAAPDARRSPPLPARDLDSPRKLRALEEPASGHTQASSAVRTRAAGGPAPDGKPAAQLAGAPRPSGRMAQANHDEASAPSRPGPGLARAQPSQGATRAPVRDDLAEMRLVATAEQLLERSPDRALALVLEGERRFARGYFQQERAYIAIMALIRLDRMDEARARAASFARRLPARPYGDRILRALGTSQAKRP